MFLHFSFYNRISTLESILLTFLVSCSIGLCEIQSLTVRTTWNANSQGGLRAYSLRNQRAYSRRALGAVTTDIPLLRQRSRSERQLRNQPDCSLSRRRGVNSRGSATMQMRVVVFANRSRQRQRERAKGKRKKHPVEFRRIGSRHPE